MTDIIDLPIIVEGEILHATGDDDLVELPYANGHVVRMPKLRDEHVERILSRRDRWHDVPLSEVSNYITKAGVAWSNPNHPRRVEAIDRAVRITGYSRPMLERDGWTIGKHLSFRSNLYDLLDAELGDHRMMDEWVRRDVARVRAFPKGRVLHVLVGNVPMAGIYSIVRSVLTKNQTVVKLPARDPVTCLAFAQTLIEENGPDHPLSQSLTVAYWDRNQPLGDRMVGASDLVCAWGQGSSMESVKRRLPAGVSFLEFGPKRSFALIFTDDADVDKAAMRVAHDVAMYDQEACFSPQRVFVIGELDPFLTKLEGWLGHQAHFLPKGEPSPDVDSHVVRTRLEATFRGWDVRASDEGGWTIIVCDPSAELVEHPLGRTIFVHRVQSVDELVPFVDDETQTISVYPLDRRGERVGDLLCRHGAVRICETGLVSHPRQGFTHDGAYPLQQFVRLAYLDVELAFVHKYGSVHTVEAFEQVLFGAGRGGLE